jgi:hypothetical protein
MPIFLGNQQITNAYLGSFNVTDIIQSEINIPQNNLIFWLDPTTFTSGSSTWNSKYNLQFSGSFTGVTPVKKDLDYAVNFTTSSAMRFGGDSSLNYTSSNFTLFVATRYSGSSTDRHGRLIDSVNSNWLAPTYGGGGGAGDTEYWAAYYNTIGFIIQSGSIYDTQWRISTIVRDTTNLSSSFYINSVLAASASNNSTSQAFNGLAINNGQFTNGTVNPATGEVTQADVGDIILYNRVLSQNEITTVYDTIKGRYGL